MDREEVIKWLKIMKANLNTFPEVSSEKKIEALAEAIRLLKNEQSIDKIDCDHTNCINCVNHKYCDYESNKSEIPTGSTTDVPENNVGKIEPTKNNLGVDCISRDSAIKALDYDIKCFEFKPGVSKYMDDIAKLLNTIYEKQVNNIKALPSVPPQEPRWIPVSKRLPEETVLACDMYGCMIVGIIYEDEDSEETGYTAEDDGGCLMSDVVAWQPLPKAYKRMF